MMTLLIVILIVMAMTLATMGLVLFGVQNLNAKVDEAAEVQDDMADEIADFRDANAADFREASDARNHDREAFDMVAYDILEIRGNVAPKTRAKKAASAGDTVLVEALGE